MKVNNDERMFDCTMRCIKLPKLFVVIEWIATRQMWDAYIIGGNCPEVPRYPKCVTSATYDTLKVRLLVFNEIEEHGGLL